MSKNYASNDNMTDLMTAIGNKKDDKPTQKTWQEYMAMTDEQREGKHFILTGAPSIDPYDEHVEVTADGVKTYATLLNELYSNTDTDKISNDSYIIVDVSSAKEIYKLFYFDSASAIFTYNILASVNRTVGLICSATSGRWFDDNGTRTDTSTSIPTNGTKITLYYGTKIAAVDFQVDADNVLMSDGETSVEDALTAGTLKFQFATDGTNFGYKNAQGNFVPFKNPVGAKSITANGTHDVTDYASASVNVPNSNTGTYTPTENGAALDMGETNSYRYVNTNTVYALGQDNPNINVIVNNRTPLTQGGRSFTLPKPNTYYLAIYNAAVASKTGIDLWTDIFATIGGETSFKISLIKTGSNGGTFITSLNANGYATVIEISSTT